MSLVRKGISAANTMLQYNWTVFKETATANEFRCGWNGLKGFHSNHVHEFVCPPHYTNWVAPMHLHCVHASWTALFWTWSPHSLSNYLALDNLHSRALWFVCWRWWVQSGDWLGIVWYLSWSRTGHSLYQSRNLFYFYFVCCCVFICRLARNAHHGPSRPVHRIIRINKNDHVPPDHGEGDGS